MKKLALAFALLAAVAAPLAAQEAPLDDLNGPTSLAALLPPPAPLHETLDLPRTLAEPEPDPAADEPAAFSIGPAGGYLRARGSDRGTWFGGVQARLRVAHILGIEGAITFHQNHYEGGDVVVTQYPVQVSAFLYLVPTGPIQVYLLGGVGWYYTRVDYRHELDPLINDRTEHMFGEHLGAGAELFLGPRTSLDADVRYIFLNPTTDKVIHRDFNYWQIAFGINFYF